LFAYERVTSLGLLVHLMMSERGDTTCIVCASPWCCCYGHMPILINQCLLSLLLTANNQLASWTLISIMRELHLRMPWAACERDAFIQASSCTNAAMMGLLSPDQVSRICKRLSTRTVDPITLTAI
jgi:hypothetical protein